VKEIKVPYILVFWYDIHVKTSLKVRDLAASWCDSNLLQDTCMETTSLIDGIARDVRKVALIRSIRITPKVILIIQTKDYIYTTTRTRVTKIPGANLATRVKGKKLSVQ
jgi:hypothetical protein